MTINDSYNGMYPNYWYNQYPKYETVKTIETVKEYDEKGRLVREVVTETTRNVPVNTWGYTSPNINVYSSSSDPDAVITNINNALATMPAGVGG